MVSNNYFKPCSWCRGGIEKERLQQSASKQSLAGCTGSELSMLGALQWTKGNVRRAKKILDDIVKANESRYLAELASTRSVK